MKVKELIQKLQGLDEELEVLVVYEGEETIQIDSVKQDALGTETDYAILDGSVFS